MLGLSIYNQNNNCRFEVDFPTNIPHLLNLIPQENVAVGKAYCIYIFCDDPPVCGATQIIVELRLYIISTT